jgi:protein-S-isoprenylcysteine O-methyltransferase Ste14
VSYLAMRGRSLGIAGWPMRLGQLTEVIAGRVLPAGLFGLLATGKANRLWGTAELHPPTSTLAELLAHYGLITYHALGVVFAVCIALLFVVRKSPIRKLPELRPQIVAVVGTYGLFGLVAQPVTLTHWAIVLTANVLLTAGMAVAIISLLTLGRCFGILPEARGLVTSGPYRYVRHPLYTSEAVAALGVVLPLLSPLTLFLFIAWLTLMASRARYEEAVLTNTFPEYAAYRRSTWRFIPGLY